MIPRLALVLSAAAFLSLGPGCVAAQPVGPPSVQPPSGPPPGLPPPPAVGAFPQGQWVYTDQYGWIWMTYGDNFVYVPSNGVGEPLEFVYYPAFGGWTWVAAPWVWGYGPWPYFGPRGAGRFTWYARGAWRQPSRWHFRAGPQPRGVAVRGVRPAPAPARGRPAPAPAPSRQARRPDAANAPPARVDQGQGRPRGEGGSGRAEGRPRGGEGEGGRVEGRPRPAGERGREGEQREGDAK